MNNNTQIDSLPLASEAPATPNGALARLQQYLRKHRLALPLTAIMALGAVTEGCSSDSPTAPGGGGNPDDVDGDGVSNANDLCDGTPAMSTVNQSGCTESQSDVYATNLLPAIRDILENDGYTVNSLTYDSNNDQYDITITNSSGAVRTGSVNRDAPGSSPNTFVLNSAQTVASAISAGF